MSPRLVQALAGTAVFGLLAMTGAASSAATPMAAAAQTKATAVSGSTLIPAQAGDVAPGDDAQKRTWVVGLGDSFMSGEGAAWIGKNYRGGSLGDWNVLAYGTSIEQTFPGDSSGQPGGMCHRSASAAMFTGGQELTGKNIACSGATTSSATNSAGVYKPGLDFDNGTGQAAQLQEFATQVTAAGDDLPVVMVSIGGNDAGFANVVSYCAKQFVTPLVSACWKSANDPTSPVGAALAKLPTVTENIAVAFGNVKAAMDAAGRPPSSYTIAYQLPPMIVPRPADMWAPLGGDHGWGRQDYGGCPFTDGDLTFFHDTLFPRLTGAMVDGVRKAKAGPLADVNVTVLAPQFTGHELCSKYTPPKDNGPQSNTTVAPFDQYAGQGGTWVAPIIINCIANDPDASCAAKRYPTLMQSVSGRVADAETLPIHPGYWGQRALAACHDLIDRNTQYAGQIVRCEPAVPADQAATLQLDDLGRPQMVVTGTSPL